MSTISNGNNGQEIKVAEAGSIGGNVSGSGPAPESEPGSVVAGAVAPPPAQLKRRISSRVRKCAGVRGAAIIRF